MHTCNRLAGRVAVLLLAALLALPAQAQSFDPTLIEAPNQFSSSNFGRTAAGLGDINADGVPDFAITNRERVYFYSGSDHSLIRTATPGSASDIANVGDIDGDEVDDLLVGTPPERALVYSGATGAIIPLRTLVTPNADDPLCPWINPLYGLGVGSIGDINGDGTPDFMIGARGECPNGVPNAGRAYVYSGAEGRLLYTLESPDPQDEGFFGEFLAGVGDLSNDGVPDIVVGATIEDAVGTPDAGRVHIFSGASGRLIRTLVSPSPRTPGRFGNALDDAGDINGDGVTDVLIGARSERRAYIFSGADGAVLRTYGADLTTAFLGKDATTIGDLSGDGIQDHAIGDLSANRVYLFSGADGALLTTLEAPVSGQFGSRIEDVGDLNGDRVPDLLVGAPTVDVAPFSSVGAAFLFETDPPVLTASPGRVDFGAVPRFTLSDPETITLTNTGGVFLTVDDVRLRQNLVPPQFSLGAPSTPFVLVPGASVDLRAHYIPVRRKARSRIEIASSDPVTPLAKVFLEGRAGSSAAAQADLAEVEAPVRGLSQPGARLGRRSLRAGGSHAGARRGLRHARARGRRAGPGADGGRAAHPPARRAHAAERALRGPPRNARPGRDPAAGPPTVSAQRVWGRCLRSALRTP
ncbi:MAG: hypothetical protein AAFY55_14995 [Bacteroidota bacterium]